ncbi:histidinol dehydrogenase [Pyrofollis japonicus]|uniref:histidinol dehydrogenase n=1 Tax=Pyrofollis japonicus TaxID=3060460 RepID=UPI00295C1736|nr:histidinol dehydrogenase [Pyrofollis japonicus]BEP17958.1 histidinol dehydrogenase [Pyrofollis japonicus]
MGSLVYIDARQVDTKTVIREMKRPYSLEEYIEKVKPIVEDVRERGYAAVREYSERFDTRSFDDPRVARSEMEEALREIGDEARWALEVAAKRIREYHEATMPRDTVREGYGLVWRPVERVGAYVPAGAKPYPSTLLMTCIPARVAGSRLVVAASPPYRDRGFKAHPLIEAAALVAGIDALYAVGGAQAVAGLAFGVNPLPRVDKIVGPGSPYVEAAKLIVSTETGIDMVAGPSEIAILADDSANPELVSLDLLAQAEHGAFSSAVLVTPSKSLADQVASRIKDHVREPHMGLVFVVVTSSVGQAIGIVNEYAPEHLEIVMENPRDVVNEIRNAGAVSLGEPVAYMDYAAGPSHVLPTSGAARWRGGLSVYDFLKPIALVSAVDEETLDAAIVLARLEGFRFHAESLEARKKAR